MLIRLDGFFLATGWLKINFFSIFEMIQEVVINRILRDMKMSGLISEETNGEVKVYLNAIYAAGYEQGIEEEKEKFGKHREKKIIQYNMQNKIINEYDSILKAAKKVKCSDRLIARALESGKPTRARHLWKYAEEKGEVNHSSPLKT
jgi:hypothetical protein